MQSKQCEASKPGGGEPGGAEEFGI